MADPLSIISLAIELISTGVSTAAHIRNISNSVHLLSPTEKALREVNGALPIFFLKWFLPDTLGQLERIDQSVLPGSDKVVLAFKDSYTSDCTQTAVAGAIVAQIAVTGLSLPYLSQTHWVARAFFIFSLISGLSSVYFAVRLQRTIGALYQVTDVKDWLSRRSAYPDVHAIKELLATVENLQEKTSNVNVTDGRIVSFDLDNDDRGLYNIDTNARGSLLSALMLSTPSNLINISLVYFGTGLAVYLGFLWTRNLDTSAGLNDSRNVFIIFLLCVPFCISSYLIPHWLKDREAIRVRLYRRLLISYEALKRDVKEKSTQPQNQHPDLDPVLWPISRGRESTLPVQAIGDVPGAPEDTATTNSTNKPPLHARYSADDVLSMLQPNIGLSRQVENESQEVLGADSATNITDYTANTSLIFTLQAAAHAHEASATADRKVAEAYKQLIDSLSGRDGRNPS